MAARKSVTLIGSTLLALICLMIAYFGLRIKTVLCQLANQPCPSEVTALFSHIPGKSVFFFEDEQLSQALKDTPAYQVQDFKVTLPGTLQVELAPQVTAYIIKPENQTSAWAVTQEGNLIPAPTESRLPQILLNTGLWEQVKDLKTLPGQQHTQWLQIITDLQANEISSPVIYVNDPQTVALYVLDQPTILIDPNQSSTNLARLKLVLAEMRANPVSGEIQEVDVRYKLPVLRNSTSIPRHTSY